MVKEKQNKKSLAKMGNTHSLKTGTTKGCVVDKLLKNNGIDFDKTKPLMESYAKPTGWNEDMQKWMVGKAMVMKEYTELAHTLGGKAIEIQDEITRLSFQLDRWEKELAEEGINPLSDKQYLAALKLKKEYLIEKSKLQLDIVEANTTRSMKKKNKEDGDDNLWNI